MTYAALDRLGLGKGTRVRVVTRSGTVIPGDLDDAVVTPDSSGRSLVEALLVRDDSTRVHVIPWAAVDDLAAVGLPAHPSAR